MKKTRLTKAQEKRIGLLNLIWMNVGLLGLLIFAGCSMCGKGCGQIPECGAAENEKGKASYIAVPLCGGCLTSERGCSTCLWGERYLVNKVDTSEGCYLSCSEIYYGAGKSGCLSCFGCSGCFRCGSTPQSTYTGCMAKDCKNYRVYYGTTASEKEFSFGCLDGCIKVDKSNELLYDGMAELFEAGIDAGSLIDGDKDE